MKIGILDQFFTFFKMVTVSRPFGIPLASTGLPVVSIMLKLGKNMAGMHTKRVSDSNLTAVWISKFHKCERQTRRDRPISGEATVRFCD